MSSCQWPLRVIIEFGLHVLVTELARGSGLISWPAWQCAHHQCTCEVESDGQVVRLRVSPSSGLLGRARWEAHHLPWLDTDHQDQV